jgi:RHS repeat-associated protein
LDASPNKPVGGSGSALPSGGDRLLAAYRTDLQSQVNARPRQIERSRVQFTLTLELGVVWRSYYYAGSARIAMRETYNFGTVHGSTVYYILTDHLGSTSITYEVPDAGYGRVTRPNGDHQKSRVSYDLTERQDSASVPYQIGNGHIVRQWYKPWGELRPGPGSDLPTDYQFTGQRSSGWGLYYFKARWFDSALGRFSQADSLIPAAGFSLAWDRYAGVLNNP